MGRFCQISGHAGLGSPHPRNGAGTLLACPDCASTATTRRTRAAPRSAPGGSAARPAGGASTSGPARPSPICRTHRTACGSPCAGVSAPRWASATSLRCSSSAASRSRTSRSAPGRSASPRGSRTSGERSGAARPAAPGPWTRPPGRAPGAGALSTAPSTARGGVLLDSMRSAHRDKHAARRFLRRRLVEVTERKPQRVTTDQPPPYRRAIRGILGRKGVHRTHPYRNHLTEQDHRAVQQRDDPMLGFGSFASAARCCSAFEELRQSWRARGRRGAGVPLAEQRRRFVWRWHARIAERAAA